MVGIKLGLPFSEMDVTNADHVDALSAVFDKAREHDTPVQLHSQTPADPPMAPDALANLAGIMADHPNVRVSYSHCGGGINPGTSGQWLRLMRPNPDSAFLDLSQCLKLFKDAPRSERERIVWLLRTWGLDRLLWGTDHIRLFRPTRSRVRDSKRIPGNAEQISLHQGGGRLYSQRQSGDGLALVYRDELLFGIGEPKWKRRPTEGGEHTAEPRYLGSGRG